MRHPVLCVFFVHLYGGFLYFGEFDKGEGWGDELDVFLLWLGGCEARRARKFV